MINAAQPAGSASTPSAAMKQAPAFVSRTCGRNLRSLTKVTVSAVAPAMTETARTTCWPTDGSANYRPGHGRQVGESDRAKFFEEARIGHGLRLAIRVLDGKDLALDRRRSRTRR